jgi:phenylalanyl-tRNA synthetase beta chain
MRILPAWLREFVNVAADDRQLAEDLTSAGIAVESVGEEQGATVYEMDLTTNRVDAMNHYGVAREASAIYGVELKKFEPKLASLERDPSTPASESTTPPLRMTPERGDADSSPSLGMTTETAGSFDKLRTGSSTPAAKTGPPPLRMTPAETFSIVIEDVEGCARYTARIIRGMKIGPSPEYIAKRLELLGSRAINNAADATNYAINELGHPTHAFDLDLLEGGTIIVRRAREGEVLKTLDGVDRKLTKEDLVIADAAKPVALAGVMGGFDSMITAQTKNVLIESAWFDPATVRSMAKRHGMHTDASHRFERGADWGITPVACDRVAELILEAGGGELVGDRIDAVARKIERAPVVLRRSEVKRILGIDLSDAEIERILGKLGFEVAPVPSNLASSLSQKTGQDGAPSEFSVTIPTWRLDVEREIDLLEELARIYGYNKFPNTLPTFTGAVIALPDEAKDARVRHTMLALGYDEAISITFISAEDAKTFGSGEALALANPLSEEAGYMRNSLAPGLLDMVAHNLNRGTSDVRLFEAGEVFEKLGDKHDEHRRLAFVATGNLASHSVNGAAQLVTFFDIKGDVEQLLAAFQHKSLYFDDKTPAYFHPGRSARAVFDGETVACFGQLHPDVAAARKLRQEVFLAEVMLDRLYKHSLREPKYQRFSKFPAVGRDFSFFFDDAVTFERIKSAVDALGIAELQSFVPVEIYRGEKTHPSTSSGEAPGKTGPRGAPAKYSTLLHAEFQSQERTLRDDEVAQWSAQIVKALEGLGGTLRAQ